MSTVSKLIKKKTAKWNTAVTLKAQDCNETTDVTGWNMDIVALSHIQFMQALLLGLKNDVMRHIF